MSDLEGLNEGPQQNTDGVTLPQQLYQPGCSEELQETHVDGVHRLGQKWWREGDTKREREREEGKKREWQTEGRDGT